MMNRRTTEWKKASKDQELNMLAQLSERDLFTKLQTSEKGLSAGDARQRLAQYGKNQVAVQQPLTLFEIFLKSLKDPFVLALGLLLLVSLLTKDYEGAAVMGAMILASTGIAFVQEYRSQQASLQLKTQIAHTIAVTRAGKLSELPMTDIVPGDLVSLATGDMIPADAVLIGAKDLFVNQSSLTGESMPVEKFVASAQASNQADVAALDQSNLVFMGTDVLSGQGQAIILKTGAQTFFGDIAKNATLQRKATTFDQGLQSVSFFLLRLILILFPIIFLINGLVKGDWGEAFFFAIAVAVGLTPEMLPMIVTSNLAKGALTLSKHQVIVKELSAVQNLGGMDILCTDKTGTITEDRVVLVQHLDAAGQPSEQVLKVAYQNAVAQTGWKNLLDLGIIAFYEEKYPPISQPDWLKIDEIPFDFSRRRVTVVLKQGDQQVMITKGAVEEMLQICTRVDNQGMLEKLTAKRKMAMRQISERMNQAGMRTIAVAVKTNVHDEAIYTTEDEQEMTFIGFMGFLDPAKASAKATIQSLYQHGVQVKVLTGDNEIVTQKVCQEVGMPHTRVLLGVQIEAMSEAQLQEAVEHTHIFAKLNPMQKARIVARLKANGHTVGFMGDGMNDAPALRKADIGISVDTAADITKDASNIILLEKSLTVLEDGILAGRKVFSNMMKYIKMTMSSNFGNVFSILIASAFLPFLPMLPLQLLVQNLIYDITQLTIPWDNVDAKEIEKPARFDIKSLATFTLFIGPVSSLFDLITYAVMWFVFQANHISAQSLFQTGWFVVGLVSQILVVQVIRTRHVPFFKSRTSLLCAVAAGVMLAFGFLLVGTPLREVFAFAILPKRYWVWLFAIISCYLLTVELAKRIYIYKIKKWI